MTFRVETHKWRASDGSLVDTGHPDAQFLMYPAGSEIPDLTAEREGLKARPQPQDKAVVKPADKAMPPPQNKTQTTSVGDLEELRIQAEAAGVKVDNRWGPERLRQELSKKQSNSEE